MSASRHFFALAGGALAVFLGAELVLDLTPWGQEWDDSALLEARLLPEAVWDTCDTLLRVIRIPSILAVTAACLAIALVRQQVLTGIVVVVAMGAAVVSAEAIKFLTPRPDLAPTFTLMVDNAGANTFPSGHATIAAALCLGTILVAAPRWRSWLSTVGFVLIGVVGCSTVIAGWHRPSDAIGGIAFATVWMALAGLALALVRGAKVETRPSRLPLVVSAVLAALGAAVVVVLARTLPGGIPLAFPSAEIAIIATALAAMTSFALCLREVDFPAGARS